MADLIVGHGTPSTAGSAVRGDPLKMREALKTTWEAMTA
jgi:hypothetical protein